MPFSFVSPVPLPPHRANQPTTSLRARRYRPARATLSSNNLYEVLGLRPPNPKSSPSLNEIRKAYLELAKTLHPDVTTETDADAGARFEIIARAWAVLGDPSLRQIYDSTGHEGLAAIRSIDDRAATVRERYSALDGEQLDFLSDTGQLIGGLLSPADEAPPGMGDDDRTGEGSERDDACPRSVEEAIWNIQFHEDRSVKYYGLWWIYKFKVKQAEKALVKVLRTSTEQTALGGYGLRRRAALALGAVAAAPTNENDAAVLALKEALESPDYFLRYRAAEALANIAQRAALVPDPTTAFPQVVVDQLKAMLQRGKQYLEEKNESKSGYTQQEGLFDLEKLDPVVREKLEKVFQDRRQNEERSKRTTMTPQLGVDEVGSDTDEPYEWILKAISAITSGAEAHDKQLLSVIRSYRNNSVPLVRYAAHKALYALTNDSIHAEEIVQALEYGVEHHYSQRVLIRDLGDVGYSKGAASVASCPMVENSFKIFALKNMLAKKNHDPKDDDVRNVLEHMDSLL